MLSFIRKFGLGYCDLPTMIKNVAVLLGILWVVIEKENTIRIHKICYVITLVTTVCYYYVYLISMIWFVFIRCRETQDLIAASVVFSLGTFSQTGLIKIMFMLFYNAKIKNIVNAYLEFDASVEPVSRYYSNLTKSLRNVKGRIIFVWIFRVVGGLVYIITPIALPGRHLEDDMFVLYGLEPMYESPNFEIAFIVVAAGVFTAIATETSTSAFISVLVGYIEAQLLTLSRELESLWEDTEGKYKDSVTVGHAVNREKFINDHVRICLANIVQKHITIINLLGEIVSVWRYAVAIQYGLMILALTSELLGGFENTFIQMPYTISQVAIDCFIGQKLTDASLALANAVYFCKWENFDKSNRRTVYLMLLNAQKTLKLSVGGFTFLGFAFFMSVVKLIYSAYTTLRSRI